MRIWDPGMAKERIKEEGLLGAIICIRGRPHGQEEVFRTTFFAHFSCTPVIVYRPEAITNYLINTVLVRPSLLVVEAPAVCRSITPFHLFNRALHHRRQCYPLLVSTEWSYQFRQVQNVDLPWVEGPQHLREEAERQSIHFLQTHTQNLREDLANLFASLSC